MIIIIIITTLYWCFSIWRSAAGGICIAKSRTYVCLNLRLSNP